MIKLRYQTSIAAILLKEVFIGKELVASLHKGHTNRLRYCKLIKRNISGERDIV